MSSVVVIKETRLPAEREEEFDEFGSWPPGGRIDRQVYGFATMDDAANWVLAQKAVSHVSYSWHVVEAIMQRCEFCDVVDEKAARMGPYIAHEFCLIKAVEEGRRSNMGIGALTTQQGAE